MQDTATAKLIKGLAVLALVACAVGLGSYYLFGRARTPTGDAQQRAETLNQMAVKMPSGSQAVLSHSAVQDPVPENRRLAMAALSQGRQPEVRYVFEKGLQDSDARTRAIAAGTLGTYNDEAATTTLAEVVSRDSEEEVKIAALQGLARCDDPRAVVTLLETAESGASKNIKVAAMKALLRKYKGKLDEQRRSPDNEASWRDLVQRWKRTIPVMAAYKAAGVAINSRPQDVIGTDLHQTSRDPNQALPPAAPPADANGVKGVGEHEHAK
jgi:hypothetical protein